MDFSELRYASALCALTFGAGAAVGLPEDQDVFERFESFFPNTSVGDPISIGVAPKSTVLTGDAFAGRIGTIALYHSGVRSWMINGLGTGVMTFDLPASTVEFWARTGTAASSDASIRVYDSANELIDTGSVLEPLPWQLFSFSGNIKRIEIENPDAAMMAIDDFGFTSIPAPATAVLLSAVALVRRRRNAPHSL